MERLITNRYRGWAVTNESWRALILLLVRVQNRYWPYVGQFAMEFDPKYGRYVDPIPRERRRFRARPALAELELSIDDVRTWYERLAYEARWIDPLPDWWVLRRSASRHGRERLKGPARRVEIYWDAAQILRLFYRTLTRRILPDMNAVGHHPDHTEATLGHKPRLYYDRGDLTRFLRSHGLYPHQLHLFVEGDCEEIIFPALIGELRGPAEAEGVRVTNLRGIDNLHRRYRELFEGFAAYARHAFLIADREGQIARYARELREAGLVVPEAIALWAKNLEEDNFKDAELVRAAKAGARAMGAELRGLTGRGLREAPAPRRRSVHDYIRAAASR